MTGGAAALAATLAARGQAWSAPLFWLESVDSTNRWLKDAARTDAVPWTVVVAAQQTAGRGRRGRAWSSPRGNLHLSVLVDRPSASGPDALSVLPLLTGVAVARALGEWDVAARLKWPNDVRVDGRKLAGILVESVVAAGATARLVIGIGVNVNVGCGSEAEEAARTAISLQQILGREVAVPAVAAAVLSQLTTCYHAPDAGQPAQVVDLWRRHAEAWWGRPVRVHLPDGAVLDGVALDIAPDGALVIEDAAGRRRAIVAGDVDRLRLTV